MGGRFHNKNKRSGNFEGTPDLGGFAGNHFNSYDKMNASPYRADDDIVNGRGEIEEDVGIIEDTCGELNGQGAGRQDRIGIASDTDPNETCTSDFYQIPITGGVPIKLTIENSRRPFTPPFAQLVKLGAN